MRSDAIVAQEAARRSAQAANTAQPDALAQRQPSVRSVVQRVNSTEADAGGDAPDKRSHARCALLPSQYAFCQGCASYRTEMR